MIVFERRNGILLASLFALLPACTAVQRRSSADVESERIKVLERELRRRQVEVQDLKERTLVLERRLRQANPSQESPRAVPVPFDPTAAYDASASAISETPPSQQAAKTAPMAVSESIARTVSVVPEATTNSGEQILYSKILETYRKRNLSELEKSLGLLLKTYPESIYADNSLYLGGQLAYELGDGTRALQLMDRVLREYPKGNKAVAALFAKAMIEKRRARFAEARLLLERLQTTFPGSPEAQRVALELKLLNIATGKRREL